jgi:hypothetical protein
MAQYFIDKASGKGEIKKIKVELELQDIKTIGNYSEKEKVKYEFEKTRNFYNRILDMVHKFRIKNEL